MKRYEVLVSVDIDSPYDSFTVKFGADWDELEKARAHRDNLRKAGLKAELRRVEVIE